MQRGTAPPFVPDDFGPAISQPAYQLSLGKKLFNNENQLQMIFTIKGCYTIFQPQIWLICEK